MSFALFALLPVLLLLPGTLQAQKSTGAVYTSPGSPLIVGQHVTTPYNSTKAQPKILPRFWHNQDSATRVAEAARFVNLLAQRIQLSNLEPLDIRSEAQFLYQFVVNSDGTIQPPVLLKKHFSLAENSYPPEYINALDKAGKRAIKSFLFSPATSQEIITIPITILLY